MNKLRIDILEIMNNGDYSLINHINISFIYSFYKAQNIPYMWYTNSNFIIYVCNGLQLSLYAIEFTCKYM